MPEIPKEETKTEGAGVYSDTDTVLSSQVSQNANNNNLVNKTDDLSSTENVAKFKARTHAQKLRARYAAEGPASSDDSGIWVNFNRDQTRKSRSEQRRGSKVSDILESSDSSSDRKKQATELWKKAKDSYAKVNKASKQDKTNKTDKKLTATSDDGDNTQEVKPTQQQQQQSPPQQQLQPSQQQQQQQQQRKSTKTTEAKPKSDNPLTSIPEEGESMNSLCNIGIDSAIHPEPSSKAWNF